TYIPAVHTDFVFAAVAEEFGLLGTTAVVALVAALMLRGFRSALRARRPFECLLAAGLSAGTAIQAWVIMAGSVRVAPITGVTLPFMSYGGSSLLTSFLSLGLILCISNPAPANTSATPLPVTPPRQPMRRSLLGTAGVLSAGLAVVALVAGWWSVPQASALQARPDDPRRVLYEERIIRGDIVDRHGVLLAGTEVSQDGVVRRRYPVPEAAPALGYATLRYGTGGIEAALDTELRGETSRTLWEQIWDDLLHRPPQGSTVRLTLDVGLQREAQQALTGHAGAIVLMDAATGDILVLASSPSYNPERLEENWDALRDDPAGPLLNRATQGLYQPGASLQTAILAEALSLGVVDLQARVSHAADIVTIDGAQLTCRTVPAEGASWGEAYAAACPAPFAALGSTLGTEGLEATVARWRLDTPPPFDIPTAAADWTAPAADAPAALADEAVGQGALVVSPLQMALVAGTLANGGTMPAPRLVDAIQQAGGWQQVTVASSYRVVSAAQARVLL
ncbi:MAG: FtsW/RodA/SpoVE family cell cycle protein, partial [Anaerolineales bacterium]|nr:FtsW/RodA/SpoVE family cell cycle protein [Anaerolineales bacterium]